jgi:carboxymethylenebutenolidase
MIREIFRARFASAFIGIFVSAFVGCAAATNKTASAISKEKEAETIQPELVTFQNGTNTLHGFIYKPKGKGPFPAVIYNHGSEKIPGWFPTLGKFWTSRGYVFFVPHRSGHGRSPGDHIVDLQKQFRAKEKDLDLSRKHDIELHEKANLDVVAAVAWLKQQSFVNTNALVMSGISYGGIQTILAAEKNLGVKALVPFAPAAMSWSGNPLLRERLLQAVKNAKSPMFLLQAENDFNLGPSELLGGELKRKGKPNRAKVYPAFGDKENHMSGHGGFAVRGSEVWGDDVISFLNEVLKR